MILVASLPEKSKQSWKSAMKSDRFLASSADRLQVMREIANFATDTQANS